MSSGFFARRFQKRQEVEEPYNQVPLCEAIKAKGESHPLIEISMGTKDKLFFDVLGLKEEVIVKGAYRISNQELISWVPVAEEE